MLDAKGTYYLYLSSSIDAHQNVPFVMDHAGRWTGSGCRRPVGTKNLLRSATPSDASEARSSLAVASVART